MIDSFPWNPRPRSATGDADPTLLFQHVGMALTRWENLETELAELFDLLVESKTRAGFSAYTTVVSSKSRGEMIEAATGRFFAKQPERKQHTRDLLMRVTKFSARRNEIAHGVVLHLRSFGYYLCPSNINNKKWNNDGSAKYQYKSDDVWYYDQCFKKLILETNEVIVSLS